MNIDEIPHNEKTATFPEIRSQHEAQEAALENQGAGASSRWTDIKSALPNFVLGACYALTAFRGFTVPLFDRAWLGATMAIEFLVIHSFPFMMLIGSVRPRDGRGERCRQAAFWGLFALYFAMALKLGGLAALATFVSLTFATYLGYMLRRTLTLAIDQLVMRWLMSFLVFLITAGVSGMPEDVAQWPEHGGVLYFGMSYFIALGILELTGFYHWKSVLAFIQKYREQLKSS